MTSAGGGGGSAAPAVGAEPPPQVHLVLPQLDQVSLGILDPCRSTGEVLFHSIDLDARRPELFEGGCEILHYVTEHEPIRWRRRIVVRREKHPGGASGQVGVLGIRRVEVAVERARLAILPRPKAEVARIPPGQRARVTAEDRDAADRPDRSHGAFPFRAAPGGARRVSGPYGDCVTVILTSSGKSLQRPGSVGSPAGSSPCLASHTNWCPIYR